VEFWRVSRLLVDLVLVGVSELRAFFWPVRCSEHCNKELIAEDVENKMPCHSYRPKAMPFAILGMSVVVQQSQMPGR
jgi:hypothetical protein